jgi:hypothetical protein
MNEDEKKYVIYNGVKVVDWWPQKIETAQQTTTCILNGKGFERLRYGSESEDWGADRHPCGDCAVLKMQFHVEGCDIEECPSCGDQMISCDCDRPEN